MARICQISYLRGKAPKNFSFHVRSPITSAYLLSTCSTLKHQYFMLFFFFLSTKKLLCFLFHWHFSEHKWILCPHRVKCSFRNAKGKTWLSLGDRWGMWQLVASGTSDHCHSEQFLLQSAAAPTITEAIHQSLLYISLFSLFLVPGDAQHGG